MALSPTTLRVLNAFDEIIGAADKVSKTMATYMAVGSKVKRGKTVNFPTKKGAA
jgi:hypothetical protein